MVRMTFRKYRNLHAHILCIVYAAISCWMLLIDGINIQRINLIIGYDGAV